MLTIGWTGGMAAGKSTALKLFAEQARLEILNADKLGHELLRDGEIKQAIVKLLGEEVLGEDGELSRPAIANRIFADRELREQYNAIVHPTLVEQIKAAIAEARERESEDIFILDAALIYEWEIEKELDYIVVVRAAQGLQLRRLMDALSLNEPDARKRMASQLNPNKKSEKAHYVIINDNDLEALERRIGFFVSGTLDSLIKKHEKELAAAS
ncbi:dephospho-CoA kinase [bacterium]|nr:dephospho-CoA kinase [bacterium]